MKNIGKAIRSTNAIDASSEFCPKCGINLNDKVECDYCGHLNPFDTEICQKCNANIK